MTANLKATATGTAQRRTLPATFILFGVSCILIVTSCCTLSEPVLSKRPKLFPIDSRAAVVTYIREFRESDKKYYWDPVSPDDKREVYIEREDAGLFPGGFFSLRLRDRKNGVPRILFTLWDADVDSGVRANVRWSTDGKAIYITGDTRGFTYEPTPDAMKYETFSFVYLVDDDKMYSIPVQT